MTTYHYQCQDCGFERTLKDRGIRSREYCLSCETRTRFERQVWVSTSMGKQGTRKAYHINPDCQNAPKNERQVNHSKLNGSYDECKVCNGSGKEHNPDFSYQKALRQAAEGD